MKKRTFLFVSLLVALPLGKLRAEYTDSAEIADLRLHAVSSTAPIKEFPFHSDRSAPCVSVRPVFPGGMAAMSAYVQKKLKYPVKAKENQVQGKVRVKFVVEPDGTVTNAEVISGFCPDCDAEALRLVAGLPKFVPGTQNGKAVAMTCYLPICFRLII